MARITINGISIDPVAQADAMRAASLHSVDASSSDYVLIQTEAPLTDEQRGQLEALGVQLLEYVSENTYLCAYKPTDLAAIRALPFVAWADVYLQDFKIAPSLRPGAPERSAALLSLPSMESATRKTRDVDVVLHDDVDPASDSVKQALADVAGVDASDLVTGRRKVRLTVQENQLRKLAELDQVRAIEPAPTRQLFNNVARQIMNASVVVNGTSFEGDGQIVAVADTGFDRGSTTDVHPAFTGRVARLYALGRRSPARADDPQGHGTHVAGSVLGDGNSQTMGGPIRGTAPRARLVLQSLIGPSGGLSGIPFDLHDLFEPPYEDDDARVHTNSWGNQTPALPYDSAAFEIDDFVWNHPDLVICWSAGNDGIDANANGVVDAGSVGSESAAKNSIVVGASESVRPNPEPYGHLRPSSYPVNPLNSDPTANDADGLAAFSSRGPTREQRIKPDVVAPGTCILSTLSRRATDSGRFGTSTDPLFFFDSGTSMATPLVAGCVAVIRESLVKNGVAEPSAALVKALLINGAVELVGQYSPTEAGPSPNVNSGFGRVNLATSVIVPGSTDAGFGEGGPLSQGEEETFTVDIPERGVDAASGSTFKVTLVWSDPPGAQLQNDLDLIVRAADGSERHGNMGTRDGFDRSNNVEQVLWANMPAGPAQVTVRAFRITQFAQPYAFAWRLG
jgi:hypothetical protein